MSGKYRKETAGPDGWSEWVHPLKPYRMACCDCGLVHELEFRIDDKNQLNFRARRANRSTAQIRRHQGIKITHRP